MCTYIYICICIYVYIYIYVYVCLCICVYLNTYIYLYIYIYVRVYTYSYIYLYIYIYITQILTLQQAQLRQHINHTKIGQIEQAHRIYTNLYANIYTYTYMYIYTHMYLLSKPCSTCNSDSAATTRRSGRSSKRFVREVVTWLGKQREEM